MNQPEQLQRETEVRLLPISITQQLAKFLDGDDSILSLLMGSVVRDLDNPSSELRFASNDIELIRNHSQEIRKSAVMIFLDEWSTMGKNRPKLRHLLALFVKCQLFRAADYLASVIGEPKPTRPQNGPAASVEINIDLPDDLVEVVNGLEDPFSGSEVNKNKPRVKQIAAPNMNFASASSENGNISIPLIPTNSYTRSSIFNAPPPSTANMNPSISNLMKFSQSKPTQSPSRTAAAPPHDDLIPAFSVLQVPDQIPITVNSEPNIVQDANIPAFSGLMVNGNSTNPSNALPTMSRSLEIPGSSKTDNAHSTSNLPMLSDLINGESSSQTRSQMSTLSTISSVNDSD